MKIVKTILLLLLISIYVVATVLISCKKESSCEHCSNTLPIAVAGPDQVIMLPTDSSLLDGSASSDPDGKIIEWHWTKIAGPTSGTVGSGSSSKTIVSNLVAGIYHFELNIKDDRGLSAKDTVQITVHPAPDQPPVANAGTDQTISLPTNSVNLDGSGSTDPDNNIASYSWTKILGPSSFNILKANAVQTLVTNLVQGVYQFELKVTDSVGLFSTDTIQVIVNAALPTADTTLRGKEFIFQNLIWDLDSLDLGPPGSVLVEVNPSNSFSIAAMSGMQVQISIQLDTSSVWISVPQWDWYGNNPAPANDGYVWYFSFYPYASSPIFLVENYPPNYQLPGRAVSVKVKFF